MFQTSTSASFHRATMAARASTVSAHSRASVRPAGRVPPAGTVGRHGNDTRTITQNLHFIYQYSSRLLISL